MKHTLTVSTSQYGTFTIIDCDKCGRVGAATDANEVREIKTQHCRDTFNDRMGLV